MSESENQAALPSFMRSLCMGEIAEELVFPYPELGAEQRELLKHVIGSVDDLMKPHEEDFRHWDRAGHLPEAFIEELKQFGLFGLVIPEEHGGLGFGSAAYSRTLQALSQHDASVAVTVGAHSSIGMRGLLLYGTDEMKAKYMPSLASGERIAAFCLTEPGSGSDAASIRTHAERDGDEWVLNGEKLWITNGGMADFFTVFAKTEGGGRAGITAFMVTPEMGGVARGPHEDKMGIRASSTTTISFDDTRVPADHVLGDVGKGFKVAMKTFDRSRPWIAAGAAGVIRRAMDESANYALERKTFGLPIAQHQAIQFMIAEMAMAYEATKLLYSKAAWEVDHGIRRTSTSAIAKAMGADLAMKATTDAVQVFGGYGYTREYPVEKLMRDAKLLQIYEGTSQIQRMVIARNLFKQGS